MCYYWYLNNAFPTNRSEYMLSELTDIVIRNALGDSGDFLCSPYYSYEDVARHHLANFLIVDDPLKDETATGSSHVAEGLLHSLVRANLKQRVKMYWPDFTRLGHMQFVPDKPWQYALIHSDFGVYYTYQPELTKEWRALVDEAYRCRTNCVPRELAREPFILMLFNVMFPYRATPEAMWLLGAEFGCIWNRDKMNVNVDLYRNEGRVLKKCSRT